LYNVSDQGEYFTCTLPPSSSAPASRMLVYSRKCLARFELPLRIHNFRSFSNGCIFRFALYSLSSGLWAVLRFVCNPSALSRRLASTRGTAKFRVLSCLLALRNPVLFLQKRFPRHFRRSLPCKRQRYRYRSLTALLQATGPVLQEVRLPASVWFLTLPCVLSTRLPSPRLGLCSAPRSLRLASSEQSTYTVPFCTSSLALASSNLPC
jgi:hypothetical protein